MRRHDEIKLIAYNIWKAEGCINGKDSEHWFKAEAIWKEKQKPAIQTLEPRVETKSKPEAPELKPEINKVSANPGQSVKRNKLGNKTK